MVDQARLPQAQLDDRGVVRAGPSSSHIYGLAPPSMYQQAVAQQQQFLAQDSTRSQQPYGYASGVAYQLPHGQMQQSLQSSQEPMQQFRAQRLETYSETPSAQYYTGGQPVPSTTTSMAEYGHSQVASQYQAATYAPSMPVAVASPAFPGTMFEPLQQTAVFQAYGQQHSSLPAPQLEQQLQQQQAQLRQAQTQQGYARYQTNISTVFTLVRDRRLRDVAPPLLEASRYLLGSVEALGLTTDEEGRHDERITLWDQYNRAWLTTMQCQFDIMQEVRAGHTLPAAQSTLDHETLESLSNELVSLCDGIEKFGLVDYQMGVAEDEIIEVTLRCLSQFESSSSTEDSGNSGEM